MSLHWHHCRGNGTEVPVLALLGMETAWGDRGAQPLHREVTGTALAPRRGSQSSGRGDLPWHLREGEQGQPGGGVARPGG